MKKVWLNKYLVAFSIVYICAVLVLHFYFNQSITDLVTLIIPFGIIIPFFSWFLSKDFHSIPYKLSFKSEWLIVSLLIIFFAWYVTSGSALINKLIPQTIQSSAWKNAIVILVKKLIVFVFIPFLVYTLLGFSLKEFGFFISKQQLFNRKTITLFLIISLLLLFYQYFFSGGAAPVRAHRIGYKQLITAIPLCAGWLIIEVGLVEEFFFRALLQSRVTVLLKSPIAGIVMSGLIFGLAHAPGLYLRGAGSEGIEEQLPFAFWACYTIWAMSLAGIFLGIIWHKTRNIYLVIGLHAVMDLLPNIAEFIQTWHL